MERITERVNDKSIMVRGCQTIFSAKNRNGANLSNAIVRLAAYEDTGLEPEEVATLAAQLAKAREVARETVAIMGVIERHSAVKFEEGLKSSLRDLAGEVE